MNRYDYSPPLTHSHHSIKQLSALEDEKHDNERTVPPKNNSSHLRVVNNKVSHMGHKR